MNDLDPKDGDRPYRATIILPQSFVIELRKLAKSRERSFSGEIRKLISDELAREKADA